MGKKLSRRFILSDSSLNRYGYRVMTEGLNIPSFRKNPVMLWMHMRDEGSRHWCDYKPIGHWEDIEVSDSGELSACPYFDLTDDLSREICAKVEEGTIQATSIGLIPITFSDDEKHLLPGQKRATVLKADLMEASFCDIPANANAVRLYQGPENLGFADSNIDIPLIKPKTMKLRSTLGSILSFLKIDKERAGETDLTEEQLALIDGEMEGLRASLAKKEGELSALVESHKAELDGLNASITALTSDKQKLTEENSQLQEQVENLKKSPVETPAPQVKKEPLSAPEDPLETLSAYCLEGHSYQEIVQRGRELKVFPED